MGKDEFFSKANGTLRTSLLFTDMKTPALGVVCRRVRDLRDLLFNYKSIGLDNVKDLVTTRCTPIGRRDKGALN